MRREPAGRRRDWWRGCPGRTAAGRRAVRVGSVALAVRQLRLVCGYLEGVTVWVRPRPSECLGGEVAEGSARTVGAELGHDHEGPADQEARPVVGRDRGMNVTKNWRGLATRYDRHALAYRGVVVLAAVFAWLK